MPDYHVQSRNQYVGSEVGESITAATPEDAAEIVRMAYPADEPDETIRLHVCVFESKDKTSDKPLYEQTYDINPLA